MLVEVKVPEMGESITEGTLTQWYKEEGDLVDPSEALYELETDKITVDVPCEQEGSLHILVEAGSRVEIGQVVATIDTEASRAEGREEVRREKEGSRKKTLSEDGAPAGEPAGRADEAPATGLTPVPGETGRERRSPREARRDAAQVPEPAEPGSGEGERAEVDKDRVLSPEVRRMVQEYGLDPEEIPGTGRDGRITREDVLRHLDTVRFEKDEGRRSRASEEEEEESGESLRLPKEREGVAEREGERGNRDRTGGTEGHPAPPECKPAPGTKREEAWDEARARDPSERQTRTRMSAMRQRIAERLVMAQQTAAILTTFNEADMSRVMEWRARHKDAFKEKYGIGLGFMSFFVKATVDALKTVPSLNAQIQGDEIVRNHYYDIGVAIGTERGLVVPVVRDADQLSYGEIESAIANLARRVEKKKLTLADLTGGVFTISNGGVYGSLLSTPILNPPQSGILGMHAIKKRPVVVEDQILIRPMMYLALSYDHRLVDGRDAVTFLKRIVECIENPERMILDV